MHAIKVVEHITLYCCTHTHAHTLNSILLNQRHRQTICEDVEQVFHQQPLQLSAIAGYCGHGAAAAALLLFCSIASTLTITYAVDALCKTFYLP